jgi:hypothetical protein
MEFKSLNKLLTRLKLYKWDREGEEW